jgi:penicillin-insensitive murein endopeptidase
MRYSRLIVAALALCAALPAGAGNASAQGVPAKQLFGFVAGPADMKARSIGSYAKGCLAGGVALPIDGEGYQAMRLSRNRNWGHPALVEFLKDYARELKSEERWPGLLIGDISQPRGGPMLTGHRSHQIGLDADIWFKPMPDHIMSQSERENVEPLLMAEERGRTVTRNWNDSYARILRRAAVRPEVARIFVHPTIKRAVCEAVPAEDHGWLRKLRPIYGHNYHFHVRLDCPAGETGCVPQKPIPEGDGCGKELDDWIKEVSKPPAPSLFPPVEEPTPETTLGQLPSECRSVLAHGRPKEEVAAAEATAVPLPVSRKQAIDRR